jgi:hypothetical protein
MPLLKPRDIILDAVIEQALVEQGVPAAKLGPMPLGPDSEDKQFRRNLNAVGASVENASLVLAEIMLDGNGSDHVRLNAAREVLILHGRKTKEGFAPPMMPIFQFNIQAGNGGAINLGTVFAPHQTRARGEAYSNSNSDEE